MSDNAALRTALFATLDDLKNGKIDIDRARAINETAQTIINSAKVEIDFMKASGRVVDNGFIPALPTPLKEPTETPTASGMKLVETKAGGSITTHRMR